ncbi:MAG: hypothetical protein U0N82_07295 [Oscillospiraceae bacterium]
MKTIYLDSDFKCHVSNDGTMTEVETNRFDGKCDAYIEGFCFVPRHSVLTRADGEEFEGEMIISWKPDIELAAAQAQYEADLAEAAAAYQEGVNSAYDL